MNTKTDYLLARIDAAYRYDPKSGVLMKSDGTPVTLNLVTPEGDLWTDLWVDGKAHRIALKQIAWFLATGEWTDRPIDARNDDKTDLRFTNLVQRTTSEVAAGNHKRRGYSTSQYKGVCWKKSHRVWVASIGYHGKQYRLGTFDDEEVAANVYNAAARELFGEHARLNPCPPRPIPADILRKVRAVFRPDEKATDPNVEPAA